MFKKNLKLICTAIGLVAVLMMGLAMPGATQQNPLSRQSILATIHSAMGATLTAAVGEQLALGAAVFFSSFEGSTWAFVPPRFLRSPEVYAYYWRAIEDLRAGKEVQLLLGGFYIAEKTPKGLNPGFYLVETVNKNKAVLLQNGEAIAELPISFRRISLDELRAIMNVGGFQEPFPAQGQIPIIITASMPIHEISGGDPGGGYGGIGGGNPPPQPPPPPIWKTYIPGQWCLSIPLPLGEWELLCIDP